jgi:hypothetical protein
MTGTAGSITLSANSVRLSNIRCVPGVAACVAPIIVTGDDCIVEECETVVHATSEFVSLISIGTSNAVCERNIIRNNTLRTLEAAGATSGILMTGADELIIEGNTVYGHFGEHCLDGTTATAADETLQAIIRGNTFVNLSDTGMCVDVDDNATGILADNRVYTGLDFEAGFDEGAMFCWENYMSDAVEVTAAIIPTAAAAS